MQIFGPQNCFGGRRGDFVKLTFTMLQWYLKCYKEQIEITSCDLLLFQPRQHNLRDHQRSVQQVRSPASRRLRRLQLQRVGRSQGWASRYLFIIWCNIKPTCGLLNFWILFPQILGQTNHLMLQECLLATTTGSPVSASLRTAWRCGNYFFTLHFSISLNFASRCALGPGTHSWRSGTKQEWFDSVQLNSSFLQNFPLNNLWRPDLKEEPSHNWNGHLYVPPSSMISKKVFWELSDSDLKWRQFQIWRVSILKPAKLQDSESLLPGLVSCGWEDLSTCCQGFWGSKRSFVSQHLIRIRAQNRFELSTFKAESVEVPSSSRLTSHRLGNQSQK